MDTLSTGTHAPALQEVLDGLNDLLQLDHDAIGAYDVAISKLEDRDHADMIAGLRRDHERHVRELNELIARLGGTPANHPHTTGPFKTALMSLGGLAGDKGVLLAFRTNELQVRTKYDLYASRAMLWPPEVKRTVDAAALDEERHYAWVAEVLQQMGIGHGDPDAAVRSADAARERANVGAGVVHEVKEKVADVAETVTGAVSSAAETVSGAAGTVGEKVSEAAGTVGEKVSGLAGSVREGVSGGVSAVRNRIAGLMDQAEGPLSSVGGRVQDAAGEVRNAASGAADTFEGRVREKPLQTLLLAGVAGFVIGRLLR